MSNITQKDRLSPLDKLAVGRLRAINVMPYFATAIMRLTPKAMPGLGTVAVTKHSVMLYDPEVLPYWSHEEMAGAIIHEVLHVLRYHSNRRENGRFEKRLWNVAADMEINDDIVAAGLKLPTIFGTSGTLDHGKACLPKDMGLPDGRTAEEYYHELEKKQAEQGQQPACGQGFCGSGGGQDVEGEPDSSDAASRTEAEMEAVRQVTADAIKEHAKGRGNVPQGLLRWADAVLRPAKVRWQDKLARLYRRSLVVCQGASDFRFDKPARRQAAYGYGPGKPIHARMVAYNPSVAVVVDTSGSMSQEELSKGLTELAAIMKVVKSNVVFMSCDAEVHEVKPISRWQDAIKLLKGGGGTDFNPVFEAAQKLHPRPDVLVFVTDGCGPAPELPPPGMKVIWLIVGGYTHHPTKWGDYVDID